MSSEVALSSCAPEENKRLEGGGEEEVGGAEEVGSGFTFNPKAPLRSSVPASLSNNAGVARVVR